MLKNCPKVAGLDKYILPARVLPFPGPFEPRVLEIGFEPFVECEELQMRWLSLPTNDENPAFWLMGE
jgi:hypothetical protein